MMGNLMKLLRSFAGALALAYVVVDMVLGLLFRPLYRYLARLRFLDRLAAKIRTLKPYPSLALFLLPIIILEPAKPVAAYALAAGHPALGVGIFAGAELLKLVIVERLFQITRDKLMSIAAFAWVYARWKLVSDWLASTGIWRAARRLVLKAKSACRRWRAELTGRASTTRG
jgi:hypothetical protein